MASDRFFTAETCDRCGKPLDNGRTMSQFNEEIICMECCKKERKHPDYRKALEAEHEEMKKGNFNFEGIGKPSDL